MFEQSNADWISANQSVNDTVRNNIELSQLGQQVENPSIVKDQLSLGEELNNIHYLLKGYTREVNEDTKELEWTPPKNDDLKILSNYGIQFIMNAISWYINKNTLLSNYDEDTILAKMEDFANDLNDAVFMEYEKVFHYPSFEQCKEVLMERLKKKAQIKSFSMELLGKEVVPEKIDQEILKEMEGRVEKEIEKIREQLIKDKLKRFAIIIREIQDAVHSTYLRAYQGMERSSLRRNTHITETHGTGLVNPQTNPRSLNPFKWFGGEAKAPRV